MHGEQHGNGGLFFFFNDTATTEIYTLSLHDASSDLGRSPGGPLSPGPEQLRLGVGAPLEQLLQLLFVPRQLFCEPTGEERNQQLADPVPLELAGDRDARPLAVIERRNRAVGNGDDRDAADTVVRPGPGRMQLDHVVSQPPRFWTLLMSARLSRSQASCTASSASLTEPSIR